MFAWMALIRSTSRPDLRSATQRLDFGHVAVCLLAHRWLPALAAGLPLLNGLAAKNTHDQMQSAATPDMGADLFHNVGTGWLAC